MKRVYVETTIPSYLTAWPSRDLVRAAHQQITQEETTITDDTVLQQVRTARDEYVRLHGYDVQKIVADLRELDRQGDWAVVRLAPKRPKSSLSAAPNQSLEQTAAATVPSK